MIGDPVSEEDCVVHLLASLPGSFNMLVTALEANPEVRTKNGKCHRTLITRGAKNERPERK